MKQLLLILTAFIFLSGVSYGQDRFEKIENKLKTLEADMPGLDEKVELSVSGVAIQEFIRGIANNSKVNINIDPALDTRITNNFSNVTVSDVLLFLCRQYNLDITFIGTILSITKYVAPIEIIEEKPKVVLIKKLNIVYDTTTKLMSMDLTADSLFRITKEITRLTGKNIIFSPEISKTPITFYIEKVSLDNAIEKMAVTNNLSSNLTEDGFYMIEKMGVQQEQSNQLSNSKSTNKTNKKTSKQKSTSADTDYDYEATSMDNITISAKGTPIADIVNDISKDLKINYFIYSEIQGNITLQLQKVSYNQLLTQLLNGTKYTFFKSDSNIYLIGERQAEGLRETKVIQLQHRSIDKLTDYIPKELQKDISIKEFPELNSLVVSGSKLMIEEIEVFLLNIDKTVPVVLIEVIIASSKTYHTDNTGIKAGLGTAPATTGGTFSNNGIQTTLSSESINNMIGSLNGFGSINLGKVTPNFYITLNALESQGYIKVRSTPKLATLNSHEATLTMGETEYYKEVQNTTTGSLNPQNIQAYQYKSVNANLSITIKPMVSGDDQITLEIKVEQSGFKKNRTPDAPPGSDNKSFSSLIRVKNEEMILLGGLEEKSKSNTGSGIPLLARIPIIKWLFSSRERDKSNSKLNIFIKPTVLY